MTPPSAGPATMPICEATLRSATAPASSSAGMSSGVSARVAGLPTAEATPAIAPTVRNGHRRWTPTIVIASSTPTVASESAIETAAIVLRETRSAIWPAGSARIGSGTNSARPTRPRSSGLRWIE